MKTLAAIFFAACLLSGCGQDKSQTVSLAWWNGYTNLSLTITAPNVQVITNVDTLEQAANILGQYGWQTVSVTGNDDASRVMYLKRLYRGNDNCIVALVPPVQVSTN